MLMAITLLSAIIHALLAAGAPSPIKRGAALASSRAVLAPLWSDPRCSTHCTITSVVDASCWQADELCLAVCDTTAFTALLACLWCHRDARTLPPSAAGAYVDALLLDCSALGTPLRVDEALARALLRVGSSEARLYAELYASDRLVLPAPAGVDLAELGLLAEAAPTAS
ncbi:uncharacterized protein LOC62_03G005074 [Vanrija pseudolonga]|uniref:Extracellular membrane protein CFEM domain-containing protein n=1 Tax=Vanrija pseudolonga TaxID=143232 RepID=A0AAF1BHU9_9TREE|nr:hypothetical protein LOC62_03G005074 [Vanrija pseudolonga]